MQMASKLLRASDWISIVWGAGACREKEGQRSREMEFTEVEVFYHKLKP